MRVSKNKGILGVAALALLGVVLVFPVLSVHAAVPTFINYQSRLRDSSSNAITSAITIQFSIYNTSSSGSPSDTASSSGPLLWTETYDQASGSCVQIDPDSEGYFTVELGSCTAFPSYLDFTSATLYVGVKVGSDSEATPRAQLGTVPYAFNATRFNDLESTSFLRSDTSDAFTSGTLTFNDSIILALGSSDDFTISHGGTNTVFDNTFATGATQFQLGTDTNATAFQVLNNTGTNLFEVDGSGNVGIGDTSPLALLTVGSGDLFQVNSSGAIAAATGITTTGIVDVTGAVFSGGTPFVLEGATANEFETTFTLTDPTADRTITIPNVSGTLIVSGHTFTSDVTATLGTGGTTALTIAADSVALTTDTTGNYVESVGTSVLTGLTGGAAGSEGATLSLAFDYSQALIGDVALAANAAVFGESGLIFEGTTANLIETYIVVTDPTTSDKTVTIPDATGTVALVEQFDTQSEFESFLFGTYLDSGDNIATATALATARTINTVSFDGTANITVTAAAGTLTGTTLNGTVVSSSLTSLGTIASLVATTADINAGTVDSLTSLSIRSTGAAFDLTFASAEVLTAGRTLSFDVGDAARTLTMAGNATISGTNTGDQTITLTGDVTGSGTGSFATTVASQTSSNWIGKVSDETGTGVWVFGTSPTITTSLSQDGDVADAGYLRLQNAAIIGWEASPAGTDVTLTVDANEDVLWTIGGGDFAFQQATTISTTTGALTLDAAGGNAAGEDLVITAHNVQLTATGAMTFSPDAAVTTAITITDTDYTNALSIGDNVILGTTAAIDFTNFDVSSGGVVTLTPGTTGTFLDFVLETEWTTGTLINADFATGPTTLTGTSVVGMLLNLNSNVTGAADVDVTGTNVQTPALTSSGATTTNYRGYQISAAGALDTTNNADATLVNWYGLDIQMPNIDTGNAADTTTSYGLYIRGGTVTNGLGTENQYGLIVDSAAGNVGIGTTSPQETLQVSGDIYITGGLIKNNEYWDYAVLDDGLVWREYDTAASNPTTTEGLTTYIKAGTFTEQAVTANIDDFTRSDDTYAVEFVGYFYATSTGSYTFGVNSDDASDFFIDGKLVAFWYGGHGANAGDSTPGGTQLTAYLETGYHRLYTRFQEDSGGDSHEILYKTPGSGTWVLIPASVLFHHPNDLLMSSGDDLVIMSGNVGIGDTTPASLLTVGSGDLFQVNSSGAIVAGSITSGFGSIDVGSSAITTTGTTSTGAITATGLATLVDITATTARTTTDMVTLTGNTLTTGNLLVGTNTISGTGLANRSAGNNLVDISISRTEARTSLTTADDFDVLNLTRTSVMNGIGGTLTAAGSVLRLENVATQTNGTLTDTVTVLEIVQDTDSTGPGIQMSGGATLYIQERADATTDIAAYGQIWVDTATPNVFMFTDDAGTDFTIANTANNLSVFAATTSAQLAGVISDETGSGLLVFGTAPTLGGTVTGPSGTWDAGGMDIATTDTYAIASTDVLNATTLGSGVTASSLTSVGALASGSIASGFGSIVATTIDATTDFIIGATVITDGVLTDAGGFQIAAALDMANNTISNIGNANSNLGEQTWTHAFAGLLFTRFEAYGVTATGGPALTLRHSMNSALGSHTAMALNDQLGNIDFEGSNGTAFFIGARINALATQTWVDGAPDSLGTRLEFHTTDDGTATLDLRWTIEQDGVLNGEGASTIGTTTGDLTLSPAGNVALGANSITMTGSLGTTGARLTKGWLTDLEVTNTIAGSITGNADTVTTNANLTGPITSVGNATSIAAQTGTGTTFVVNTSPTLVTPVLGVATGTSLDLGGTTLFASRAITVDTGGVLNIVLASAAGDDFTIDTSKLVVEGDTGNVGIGTAAPSEKLEILAGSGNSLFYGTLLRNSDNTDAGGSAIGLGFSVNTIAIPKGAILFERTTNWGRGDLHFALNNNADNTTAASISDAKMTILTSGNVGIGTTNPLADLHISRSNASSDIILERVDSIVGCADDIGTLQFYGGEDGSEEKVALIQAVTGDCWSSTSSNTELAFHTTSQGATSATERVRIDSAGNVGIGTGGPTSKLNIVANTDDQGNEGAAHGLIIETGTSDQTLFLGYDGTGDFAYINVAKSGSIQPLALQTRGGNVGIGTASPSQLLHVSAGTSGDAQFILEADTDNNNEDDNPTIILRQDGNLVNGLFGTMGSTSLYTGSIANALYIEVKDTGGTSDIQFVTGGTTIGGTNGTARMTINQSGNIGIAGVTSPAIDFAIGDTDTGLRQTADGVLDIMSNNSKTAGVSAGRFFVYNVDNGAAENPVCREASGKITRGSSGCNTSSIRYKQNVQDLNYGLEEIMQLRPVSYQKKTDPNRTQFGLIAEEVADIFPEIIGYEPDDPTLIQTYDYRGMHSVLIKAIQELNLNLEEIASTIPSVDLKEGSFASRFFSNLFERVSGWLADAANGIKSVFADTFYAKEKICVDGECLTKDDIRNLLSLINGQVTSVASDSTVDAIAIVEPEPEPTPVEELIEPEGSSEPERPIVEEILVVEEPIVVEEELVTQEPPIEEIVEEPVDEVVEEPTEEVVIEEPIAEVVEEPVIEEVIVVEEPVVEEEQAPAPDPTAEPEVVLEPEIEPTPEPESASTPEAAPNLEPTP